MKKTKIGFIGISHLGIISSIASAQKGNEILCFDKMFIKDKINPSLLIKQFYEPGLNTFFEKNKKNIYFTDRISSFSDCKIIYISCDIKTNINDESNYKEINYYLKLLNKSKIKKSILIILSQVYPGFTRKIKWNKNKLYYQVETLSFGKAIKRALNPERIIIGSYNKNININHSLKNYLNSFSNNIIHMSYESAELAKISINMMLVSNITMSNLMSSISERIGAEWKDIVPALKLDRRIGKYSYVLPSMGISGGNLNRDIKTSIKLVKKEKKSKILIESFLYFSDYSSSWAIRKFNALFKNKKNKICIGILGLTYKEDTNSLKNSASIKLIKSLNNKNIKLYDPVINKIKMKKNISLENNIDDVLQGIDCLFIMTPWKIFRKISYRKLLKSMKRKIIIDPYEVLQKEKLKKNGFKYYSIGSN